MNLFCGNLEELFKKYQVYNVPTMGMDDFMVVSGMPNVVGDKHVSEIASMAFDLLAGFVVLQIPHRPNMKLNVRMGFHSGPAVGVVAGSKLPSYCIMSKTLAVARRIESLGEGMRIHISEDSKQLLDKVGGFRCDYHGTLELGPDEKLDTFWLIGPDNTFADNFM